MAPGNSPESIFGGSRPLSGFHPVERDIWGPFVWAERRFRLRPAPGSALLALRMCYPGREGVLTIRSGPGARAELTLHEGWHTYPLDLSGLRPGDLECEVRPLVRAPGDARELGVMIRRLATLEDRGAFKVVESAFVNRVANEAEHAAGRSVLESLPQVLRINSVTRCNIRPPCVYCYWEWPVDGAPEGVHKFSGRTLHQVGRFFRSAVQVGESSQGEPLLNDQVPELAARLHRLGKQYELTTNGKLLGAKTRSRLLGLDCVVYVSLDSHTPEGYARYRDDGFDLVARNLRALCRERAEHRGLPAVIAAPLFMRSNRGELEAYLRFVHQAGVDGVKLRTLNLLPGLLPRRVRRAGFDFDYAAECLTLPEARELVESARLAARDLGLPVVSDLDTAADAEPEERPLCSDPWRTLHLLGEGIVTCCAGKERPVARWSERGERSLETFLSEVWNGPYYRELRASLAAGRLPAHCVACTQCPIVRAHTESRAA